MASATTIPEYREVLDGLARAIRKRRAECPPHETARRLLEYDNPGHTALVGIGYDAERAVLFHERDDYVIAVPFDADGLADGGPMLAEFGFGTNVYGWVRRMDAYWCWLNPRFR